MVKKLKQSPAMNDGNYIKFLGTAGARFVMIKQLRSSGGIWVSYKGTNVIIDPGPGSITRFSFLCGSSGLKSGQLMNS